MSRQPIPPRPEQDQQQWETDYQIWLRDQEDEEIVNRMLRNAEDDNEAQ